MRIRVLAVTVAAVALVGTTAWWVALENPPTDVFDQARIALAQARKASADRYAPAPYRRAEVAWRDGMAAWRAENGRAAPFRSYESAERLAREAATWADRASRRAHAVEDSLSALIEVLDAGLLAAIREARTLLRRLPGDSTWSAGLNEAALLRQQAVSLRDERQLGAAAARLGAARTQVRTVQASVMEYVDGLRVDLPEWRENRRKIVKWSRSNRSPALLVDKLNRTLYVLERGKVTDSISVDLGPGWDRPKQRQGDRATPEGLYHVIRKRGPGATRYHRALEIDYPNQDDLARFADSVADGSLPPDAQPGGLIELHGQGGSGADWTDGCIALTNQEMEALYRRVPSGTPVMIVRALRLPRIDRPGNLHP